MQVVLVMFRSDGERRSFSVVRNMTVIGRREDCDLRIPVGDVSRKHCRIMSSDDGIRIEDLGSSNGTFVNHERVQQSDLNPGDTLGVGPVQFIVQINGVPDDDELVPPTAAPSGTHEDSDVGYQAPTVIDERSGESASHEVAPLQEAAEDELAIEEFPAEELATDELPAEELAAEELPEEELIEEAEPLEELSEAEPVEELAVSEEPIEELSEDELSFEDELPLVPHRVATSAGPVDELELAEAPTEEELEPLEELDETVLSEDELEEAPLAAGHLEPLEELEFEAKPAELEELEVEAKAPEPPPLVVDELDELPLPPPTHVLDKIEDLELDADEHDAEGKSAEGSAWDFVIEETETEQTSHGLHIDLDAPHQQQPHN